jgi:hypothetical protein
MKALALAAAVGVLSCTPAQRREAKTALELSICVQGVVLENVDQDIKDPFVAAQVAQSIADQCSSMLQKGP